MGYHSPMKKQYAIEQFGSVKALARELGITVHAVYMWKDDKDIPPLRAYQIRDALARRESAKGDVE